MIRRPNAQFAVKAIISALLLGAVLRWTGIDAVRESLALVDIRWVIPAIVMFFPTQWLGAFRWHLLLQGLGRPQPLARVIRYYLLGQISALALPGQVSGDLVRTSALAFEDRNAETIALSVLVDKGLLLAAIFACTIAGQTTKGPLSQLSSVYLISLIGLVATMSIVLALCRVRNSALLQAAGRMIAPLLRLVRMQPDPAVESNIKQISYSTIVLGLFFAFGFQIANSIGICLLAHALRIDIAPVDWLAIYAMVSFVQIFPLTIGGLGIREGTMTAILSLYSVPNATAASISLLGFGLIAILLMIAWLAIEIRGANL